MVSESKPCRKHQRRAQEDQYAHIGQSVADRVANTLVDDVGLHVSYWVYARLQTHLEGEMQNNLENLVSGSDNDT